MLKRYQKDHLLVALDCVIFGFDKKELKLLLIKRNFEPEKGKWSLMGGFLKKDEDLTDAAKRILFQLTGLTNVYMEQLQTFGEISRDPVERTVSVCYYALINIFDHEDELMKQYSAKWCPISQIDRLIFDHNKMVKMAIQNLRYKASHQPVGFELLPSKFTMPELQKLYEAIYQTTLDKRNFSKKMLSTGALIKLKEKQIGHSRKGAFYYKFNRQKYRTMLRINEFDLSKEWPTIIS